MRYIIVIDANSAAGAIYAKGSNDGFITDGHVQHPVLDCTEIETSSPYYIFAKRSLNAVGESHQSLYLPHGSVVMVVGYADEQGRPVGFVR